MLQLIIPFICIVAIILGTTMLLGDACDVVCKWLDNKEE